MKPMNERDPFKVGIVALSIGALLFAGLVSLSFINFGTTNYTAVLEHTAGLRTGEAVEVYGVESGKITDIRLEEDRVVVDFALDSSIPLGSRSEADVKVATLLGTHYLDVVPIGSGELADGTIPLERTQVPYNLQDVLESGSGALDELDPELLARALTSMAGTLGASEDEIGPALEGVARLSSFIVNRADQTGSLLESAESVTTQLADSTDDIVGLMTQTNLVVSEITARRQAIHTLLVEAAELSVALKAIIRSTRGQLRPALQDLTTALTSLVKEDHALEGVLESMAPAVRYVANAAGNGPWVDLYVDPPALPPDDVNCSTGQRTGCS